ncbi:MAG TPA: ATP-binding protein [Lentisphaeria bacterium]|mgnify:CR=1 FL=1|nr:ATP-binding protein [Lentisphaeria bacterium]
MPDTAPVCEVTLPNDTAALPRLADAVTAFCAANALGEQWRHDLNLALEEAVSNVMLYAYHDHAAHTILVRLAVDGTAVHATIEDDGVAFNPLDAPAPDLTVPVEERPIGGLGILFVKELMDDVRYARRHGKNVLELVKCLTPS